MNNHDIAIEITEKAKGYFNSNLVGVLLYGSSISAKKKPNDIDLVIILGTRESASDLAFFRKEVNKYNKGIDLQILNTIDINSKHFSHDSHGEFFIQFLKFAKVIFGKNPFLEINIDYSRQVSSVIQKLQYYYFRAKKIQANAPLDMDDIVYNYHRKKILLCLSDFCLVFFGKPIILNTESQIKNTILNLNINISDDQIKFILGENKDFPWENIFDIYQLFYFTMIDILDPKIKIKNININNLFTKIYKLEKISNKVAIISSGCPSDYDESEIALFLNIKGYDVIAFHYSGTGLSLGNDFTSPTEDLLKVIKFIENKYNKQIIVSNSYGGFPALAVSNVSNSIDKIIAISPVIDFKKLANYNTLPTYLTTERKNEYRFNPIDMLKFMENAKIDIIVDAEKINIIHGFYDEQIPVDSVESFCRDIGIKLDVIPTGHLSLNKIARSELSHLDSIINTI